MSRWGEWRFKSSCWKRVAGKGYVTERNGISSWQRQGHVAIWACKWMNLEICVAFVTSFQKSEMQLLDSSCPSFCLSVPQHEEYMSERLWIFRKSYLNIDISLQSDNNSQCFTPDRFTFAVSTGWMFVIMRQFWDTFWEEIKTHFSFIKLFSKMSSIAVP